MNRWQHDDDAARVGLWLSELADALDEAQRLMSLLGLTRGRSAEARDLYRRLELARAEIEDLQQSGTARPDHFGPDWVKSMLESANRLGPADPIG